MCIRKCKRKLEDSEEEDEEDCKLDSLEGSLYFDIIHKQGTGNSEFTTEEKSTLKITTDVEGRNDLVLETKIDCLYHKYFATLREKAILN